MFFEPRSRLAHPEDELYIKDQNSRSSEQNSAQAHALNKEPQPVWSQPPSCGKGASETMRRALRKGLTLPDLTPTDRTFMCSQITA